MNNYVNCCCITEDMLKMHGEMYDNCFMGSIVLYALGINAACTTFCLCKSSMFDDGKHYNISWICDDETQYMHTIHVDQILAGLNKMKVVFKGAE